jgi:hypothetical protein
MRLYDQSRGAADEWWSAAGHLSRVHHIVETNHTHLIENANIAFVQCLINTRCLSIVARKDRGGRIRQIEQGMRLLDAITEQVISFVN